MYDRKDAYYRQAKKEGYKSRAAYKLLELNKKYQLIRSGDTVLDCGAAPGGWSQVALELIGGKGRVVGIDLQLIDDIIDTRFTFIHGDLTHQSVLDAALAVSPIYDSVISDAAPKTTGIREADHGGSVELITIIWNFTKKVLKPKGSFTFKLFEGPDRDKLVKELKPHFDSIKLIRPDATRKGSMEMYIICKGFKTV